MNLNGDGNEPLIKLNDDGNEPLMNLICDRQRAFNGRESVGNMFS